MVKEQRVQNNVAFVSLFILAALVLAPILIVLMNSFKGRFFISDSPFAPPYRPNFFRNNKLYFRPCQDRVH